MIEKYLIFYFLNIVVSDEFILIIDILKTDLLCVLIYRGIKFFTLHTTTNTILNIDYFVLKRKKWFWISTLM